MGRPPLICPHGNLGVKKCVECCREKQRRSYRHRAVDPVYRARKQQSRAKYRSKLIPEIVAETHLRERIEKMGGMCPKFIDPSRRGAPDRMVLLPGRPVFFVEMKREVGGVVKPWQTRYHEDLRALGHRVWVLWSKEEVDAFISEVTLT